MLKRLIKNEGLNFSHKWEFDGKEFEAEFEIQVEKGTEKEIQITVDQIKGRNSAVCLFNEEYNLDEGEILIQDLEEQNLEFVIKKIKEVFGGKMLKEILSELNESHLLNQVGRILAEQPVLFPRTFDNMAEYFDGVWIESVKEKLATSSLTGADAEKAIQEWIAEDEQWQMWFIIDVENDVEMEEIHDGEWCSTNGRWSATRNGVCFNWDEGSELVGDMVNVPDEVQKIYDELQGE